MLDVIFGFFNAIFGLLSGLLPSSPFTDYLHAVEGARLGLSWLNWLVPIHDFLTVFLLWIAAGLAISLIRLAISETLSVGTSLGGM